MIPAYNEEQNIEVLLSEMYDARINEIGDILVINDGSEDNTEEIVRKFSVTILNQAFNMGYCFALQVGYKYAKKHGYEYVIQIDADGQHDICNIEKIYDCLKNKNLESSKAPDIVIGSRFLKDSVNFKIPKIKILIIMFFRILIKIFTKINITDPTSGLHGLNRVAFSHYAGYCKFDYYYPDVNMIIHMIMQGLYIKEIPAIMHERKIGQGMHSGIIKPIKYMVLIILSTLNIIIRNDKNTYLIEKEKIR